MRSLSILLGYLLLGAGLYWESSSKPRTGQSKDDAQSGIVIPVKNKKIKPGNHLARQNLTPAAQLEYLTSGAWRMRAVVSDQPCDTDGDGVKTTNVMAEMPPCAKDDVLFIRKGGRAVFERGLPCADEPTTQSYDWTLSKDGIFTLSAGSIEAEMQLLSADADTLKMIISMEDGGKMYHFTVTYTH